MSILNGASLAGGTNGTYPGVDVDSVKEILDPSGTMGSGSYMVFPTDTGQEDSKSLQAAHTSTNSPIYR